ncbi:MAG: hypothetical protein HYX27_18970 [Acidobacteria bacterium]|nr:hypothetical protein [Acidobacteriota bacterium]
MRYLLFFSMFAAWAERPEFGAHASWPAVTPYRVRQYSPIDCGGTACTQLESAGRRAILGLSLRIPVAPRFALRITPAWQRISFDYTSNDRGSSYALYLTANRWELPVVAEWRLAKHVRPGIGGVASVVTPSRLTSKLVVNPGFGTPGGYTNVFRVDGSERLAVAGLVADVEFPFRVPALTIAPNLRYTRWVSKHFGERGRLDNLTVGLSLRF